MKRNVSHHEEPREHDQEKKDSGEGDSLAVAFLLCGGVAWLRVHRAEHELTIFRSVAAVPAPDRAGHEIAG
jgi:hypothetical protein